LNTIILRVIAVPLLAHLHFLLLIKGSPAATNGSPDATNGSRDATNKSPDATIKSLGGKTKKSSLNYEDSCDIDLSDFEEILKDAERKQMIFDLIY